MKEYKLGDIFELDEEYSDRAQWCNENGYMIVEITNDEDFENSRRRFQIVEVPKPSERELAQQKIYELKQQLAKYKEDVEQVELFEMERTDYNEKKKLCAQIILELRELEKIN